ncbi:DUF2809 domain-containing protein [Clostridium sp.]|uniref:ribosomal maturation YjgA family protein n=1 Tax=Clostridium sp. TaxID=1506 RepID=UPI003217281E
MKRNRVLYIGLIILVIIFGLLSRKYAYYIPLVISKYSGDTLWALMIYLGFGFLLSKSKIKYVAIGALIFSYGIELSQLYQGQWINVLRDTTIGGLILGHGFLFSDLICYTVGIAIGIIFEVILERK